MRIDTDFDKDTAMNGVQELLEANSRLPKRNARLIGTVHLDRVAISYRTSWIFVPPFLVATFLGKVVETETGAEIKGRFALGWVTWLIFSGLGFAVAFAIGREALSEDYSALAMVLLVSAILFFLVRACLKTAKRYISDELIRAMHGRAI